MKKGTLLKQRYRVVKTLGSGGFGVTYLAEDSATGRLCAVKHLSLASAKDTKSMELFQREARVLSGLDHPRIPDFVDFFQEESADDISVYLVQQYIAGCNLAELIKQGQRFDQGRVIEIGIAVARILKYLHNASPPVIHRDIKPSNILLGNDGEIYLIDFGAVRDKMLPRGALDPTIVGTYGYMPMEQFGGKAVPASDIYSLGVTLIAVLTRREPAEIAQKNFRLDYRPLVNVSPAFARVLDRMIAPQAAKRFHTAQSLREALEKLLTPLAAGAGRKKIIAAAFAAMVIALVIFFQQPARPPAPVSRPARVALPAKALPQARSDEPVQNGPPVIRIPFDGGLEGLGVKVTFATTNSGAVAFGPGKQGQAVHLVDGGLEYVETAAHAFKHSYTLQFWLQLDDGSLSLVPEKEHHPVLRSALLTFDVRRAGESLVFVHGAAGGHMQMRAHDRVSPIVTGRWYHLAVVKSAAANRMDLFVDGRPMDSIRQISMRPGDMFDVLKLGLVHGRANASFQGWLDELEIFDYARAPGQILTDAAPAKENQISAMEHCEVSGRLLYDGRPISEFTSQPACFWFRNEGTGREQSVEADYADGRFQFRELKPGRYGVDISVPAGPGDTSRSPGTFKAWQVFSVLEAPAAELQIETHRLIHLLKPQNNAEGLERWDARCEGKPDFASPVLLQWEPVADRALYRYKIERWSCDPFKREAVQAQGVTDETWVQVDLPGSAAKEMLIFTLTAEKDGRRIGKLETFGKVGGRSWDYRFRVR